MTLPANPDLEAARQLLAGAERVLTITHVSPDGDAIGSLLGFGLALRAAGKDVVFACADSVPDAFRFLPAAPTNAPWVMVAAAGYTSTCKVESVVFSTSMRRCTVVPGLRLSTM